MCEERQPFDHIKFMVKGDQVRRKLLNRRDVLLFRRELDREQPVIGRTGIMDVEEVPLWTKTTRMKFSQLTCGNELTCDSSHPIDLTHHDTSLREVTHT